MTVVSVPRFNLPDLIRSFVKSKSARAGSALVVIGLLLFIKVRNERQIKELRSKSQILRDKDSNDKRSKRGLINLKFFRDFLELTKVAVPSYLSILTFELSASLICLILRTFLSVYIARINGGLVKGIINRDLRSFVTKIFVLLGIALPASFLNSYLEYLRKSIAYHIRENITYHFLDRYLKPLRPYQVSSLDNRVSNPDQRLTSDIECFANSFSSLFSNTAKPFMDVLLFGYELSKQLGYKSLVLTFGWYGLSAVLLKLISPPIGLLTAIGQELEGEYRDQHGRIVQFGQAIAFLERHKIEPRNLHESFERLHAHKVLILSKRVFLNFFDGVFVKYGSTIISMWVLSVPSMKAFKEGKQTEISELSKNYIQNGSLMFNLAKSIGRLVVSFKDLQAMAGYTVLLKEFMKVLVDLEAGKFTKVKMESREEIGDNLEGPESEKCPNAIESDQDPEPKKLKRSKSNFSMICEGKIALKGKGELIISKDNQIVFNDVPLITPSGDVLVESMSFVLKSGKNLIISGPNGCGKSSLFRVLGGLWPIQSGQVERPEIEKLFYLPQRPYLTEGSLKDQILYPQIDNDDPDNQERIKELLRFVELDNLLSEGIHVVKDWEQVLSGGEKQMIAMARLLYHSPSFAILDECTSTVSMEMEARFYQRAKEQRIALFTISHRQSLNKYHDYFLKFDGRGNYQWIDLCSVEPILHL